MSSEISNLEQSGHEIDLTQPSEQFPRRKMTSQETLILGSIEIRCGTSDSGGSPSLIVRQGKSSPGSLRREALPGLRGEEPGGLKIEGRSWR